MEKHLSMSNKRSYSVNKLTGRKLAKGLLPVVFSLFLLSGCGSTLEKPFHVDTALTKMNSVNSGNGEESLKAQGFAYELAVPGTTDFNNNDITSPVSLLVELGADGHPESVSYSNPYTRSYPASITKLMTALVCLENVNDLQQEFTVTQNSIIKVSGSSTAWLQAGETLSIEELLYGMLLPSGNDAAVAVAEATAGSVDAFVQMMNAEALRLGCTGTHFVNPNGLPDDNHYTTPYDIYLILREALKYDTFREIVGSESHTAKYKDRNGQPKSQTWKDTNLYLLGEKETPAGITVLGGKTGTTKKAGYCLAMAVRKDDSGKEYIAIVMQGETKDDLYENMTNLLLKLH